MMTTFKEKYVTGVWFSARNKSRTKLKKSAQDQKLQSELAYRLAKQGINR